MVRIPRRQVLTEKMEPYNAVAGNDLKLAGSGLKGAVEVTKHAVDRATPFAVAVRGTPQDNGAANFIREITGINNQFAMVDLEGDAKIRATKINSDLQKKYADDPTCPDFAAEVESSIGAIFDEKNNDVPISQQLKWQQTKQNTLKQFKAANQKWAEEKSLKNMERRVKKLNEEANNRANFYGEKDSLDEFMADHNQARDLLTTLADDFKMSREEKQAMLSAFDTQQIYNYLKGLAIHNPDKAEQIVNNDEALGLLLGTKGREDLTKTFKAEKTKKQKALKAELGMPSNWGDTTRRATMAYADRLQAMGLERDDAIAEAVKKMKEQETNVARELASDNVSDDRMKELKAQLAMFTGTDQEEMDYDKLTDEEWESLSAKEQQELLKKDLEKHIKKGKELQKTRVAELTKQQMYDDFNEFINNPSEGIIAARKATPEYYLDNNYRKLTDAMDKWYKSYFAKSAEETAPSELPLVLQALLLPELQGTEKQREVLTNALEQMESVQNKEDVSSEDKQLMTTLVQRFVNDPGYLDMVRQTYQSAGVENLYKEISTGYLKKTTMDPIKNAMRTGITSSGEIDPSLMSETQRYIFDIIKNTDMQARYLFADNRPEEAQAVLDNMKYKIMFARYGNILDTNVMSQILDGIREGKQVKFAYKGDTLTATGIDKYGTLSVIKRISNGGN